jgi:hypothetical protein
LLHNLHMRSHNLEVALDDFVLLDHRHENWRMNNKQKEKSNEWINEIRKNKEKTWNTN